MGLSQERRSPLYFTKVQSIWTQNHQIDGIKSGFLHAWWKPSLSKMAERMNNLLKCIVKLLSIVVFFESCHIWMPKQKVIMNLLERHRKSVILVLTKSESNSLTMTQTSFRRENTTITCIFGSPPKRFLIALTISESEGVQDLVSKSRVLATSSLRDQVTISPPPAQGISRSPFHRSLCSRIH